MMIRSLLMSLALGTAFMAVQAVPAYAQTTETDQSEEDWRNSRKKRSTTPDIFDPNVNGIGQGLPDIKPLTPIERLPRDSQRHLKKLRAEIIAESDPGQPVDTTFKPSEAAQNDPDLAADEEEAWKIIVTDLELGGGQGSQPPQDQSGQGEKIAVVGKNNTPGSGQNSGGGFGGGGQGSGQGSGQPSGVLRGGSSSSVADILAQIKGIKAQRGITGRDIAGVGRPGGGSQGQAGGQGQGGPGQQGQGQQGQGQQGQGQQGQSPFGQSPFGQGPLGQGTQGGSQSQGQQGQGQQGQSPFGQSPLGQGQQAGTQSVGQPSGSSGQSPLGQGSQGQSQSQSGSQSASNQSASNQAGANPSGQGQQQGSQSAQGSQSSQGQQNNQNQNQSAQNDSANSSSNSQTSQSAENSRERERISPLETLKREREQRTTGGAASASDFLKDKINTPNN